MDIMLCVSSKMIFNMTSRILSFLIRHSKILNATVNINVHPLKGYSYLMIGNFMKV